MFLLHHLRSVLLAGVVLTPTVLFAQTPPLAPDIDNRFLREGYDDYDNFLRAGSLGHAAHLPRARRAELHQPAGGGGWRGKIGAAGAAL